MVKYIGVWDFFDTPVDDGILNRNGEETYSVQFGNRIWNIVDIINNEDKPLSGLIVESHVAFYHNKEKILMQEFLRKIKSDGKFPIIIFSSDFLGIVDNEYGLKEGEHYDKYLWKSGFGSPLDNLRNTLDSLLK